MAEGIPHLTFAIVQSLDRLEWQHGVYNDEFLERLKLCMGHPAYFSNPTYGVVAPADPTANLAGGPEPLVVSTNVSFQENISVDVNPGMVVTKSGNWAVLSSFARQIPLAVTDPGIPNVVYMAYSLQPADEQQNKWLEMITPLYSRLGDISASDLDGIVIASLEASQIYVDTVETYLNYAQEVAVDFVPLAVVTVQESVDPVTTIQSTTLSIDHTRDTYLWNRPWFSVRDVEHRNKLGSGTQTDNNTHALGFSDLDDAGFTPYQLMLNHGMVRADDRSIDKIPGYRCQAAFLTEQLLTDDTLGSATGFPSKKYAKLPYFPVRVGRCWIESSDVDMAVLHVRDTNRVVFAADDPPAGETVNIYFTRVRACEPPSGDNEIAYTTNNPGDGEIIVAGGQGKTQLASTQEGFSDAYKFPMRYLLYVDEDASMRKTPQVIYCFKRLDDLGIQDAPEIDQYAPGHIMVGLTEAATVATMVVKIHIYGTDPDGVDIDEIIEFNSSTWSDFTIPSTAVPTSSLAVSTNMYSAITNIVVDERTDDGSNSAIMMWAINTPYDSYDKLKDACLISDVMWDGLRLANIYDKRIIETTIRDFMGGDIGLNSLEYWLSLLAGNKATRYVEDFKRPRLHNLRHPKNYYDTGAPGDAVEKYLPHNNFSKLQVNLNGIYRTRALPVLSGSDYVWTVSFLPQAKETGIIFGATVPRMRFKVSLGWSSQWYPMVPVSGIPNTYEFDTKLPQILITHEVPVEVQFEVDPYPYVAMAIFG